MYFSNISDAELSQYHNQVYDNFSMALVTVLTSPLFKIETIVSNSIYKIYPLFYCKEISSSNNEDKIIENKCIICTKDTNTRLYFKTDNEYTVSSLGCSWTEDWTYGIFMGTVFDENGHSIYNAEVTLEYVLYGQSKKNYETMITDFDGLFYFGLSKQISSMKVIIKYDNLVLEVGG